jgi:hypothetical protein
MSPDDPRHGTPAGSSAHRRAGERACLPCRVAKSRSDKQRRVKGSSHVPLGERAWAIVRDNPLHVVGRATGISECALRNMVERQGLLKVTRDTKRRILTARLVTDEGLRRRVRALCALGWSAREIARAANVNVHNVLTLRDGRPRKYVRREFQQAILDTYERMQMTTPPPSRWATAQIMRARRNGWAPPLAWDDIDDPHERPQGVGYVSPERADALRDLHSLGATLAEVCRQLEVRAESLERWCTRHGMYPLYVDLVRRERAA